MLLAAAEALAAAPGDVAALTRTALALDDMGNKSLAARAFEALAASAREQGQVALALYAAASLDRLGDVKGGKTQKAAVAKVYGKGSPRVDAQVRARPPALSRAGKPESAPAKGAAANDAQAAMKVASDALGKAAAHAADLAKQAGKLPAVPLVCALPAADLETLAGVMKPVAHKAGDVVMDVGDAADALYLVARGALEVSRDDETLARLTSGAFFGEIALLVGARRIARVTCVEDCWLLMIPRAALEAAAAKAPAMADTLARYARQRLLATTMRTSEIFKRLDAADRDALVPRFQSSVLAPAAKVIKAGEEGDRLHVVVSGELDVKRDGKTLDTLGPGDVFGEMSLLGRRPATADVVARTRTVTLSLARAKFDDVAMKHPELLAEVYRLVVQREAKNRADAAEPHEVTADDIVV